MSVEEEHKSLTEVLAEDFNNKIGQRLDDDVRLADLMMPERAIKEERATEIPENRVLREYLEQLDSQSRGILTKPIRMADRRLPLEPEFSHVKPSWEEGGGITVGMIREADIELLQRVKGIGPKGALFLKKAFTKPK